MGSWWWVVGGGAGRGGVGVLLVTVLMVGVLVGRGAAASRLLIGLKLSSFHAFS